MTDRDRSLRALLRRIALGLPLVSAPVVLLGCSQHCTPGATMSTIHTATAAVRAQLGMGTTFDASACRDVCLALDGVTASGDAGVSPDDAGSVAVITPAYALGATVNCGWSDDTTVQCNYQGATVCSGGSSCIIPPCAVAGRLPSALLAARPRVASSEVAAWLAETARLEAAAIDAFEDLAVELTLHDAPRTLVAWARTAAADERRHAGSVARLAHRAGARPADVQRAEHAPRSLRDVALDNAAEGCVREAFGAITAAVQASEAQSTAVRATFAAIAREEASHALFSIALDDWARARLGGRALADVRHEARARLARDLEAEASPLVRAALGLPDAGRAIDSLALIA